MEWRMAHDRVRHAARQANTERREKRERPSCLVGFLGFPQPLPVNTRGVLERCEIQPVELSGFDKACRVMETLTLGAVVVDTHRRELTRAEEPLARFLQVASRPEARTPLIVLTSVNLSSETRCLYLDAGARFLLARRQTRRQLATVIRRVCGRPGRCCEPISRFDEPA